MQGLEPRCGFLRWMLKLVRELRQMVGNACSPLTNSNLNAFFIRVDLAVFKIFLHAQKWLTYDKHRIRHGGSLWSVREQVVCLCKNKDQAQDS